MRNCFGILILLSGVCGGATLQEFVFDSAPFQSCHASTVVELRNGDILAAWFGGSGEGKPDVAIWSARRHAGKWQPIREVAREPNIASFNPVLFYTKDGRLWLYYKFGPHPTSWTGARKWSSDDGETWSSVEHLPAGLTGPIRAKPLLLSDGTIVSGTSVESYHSWACWVERSTDNGQTWKRFGPIAAPSGGAKPGATDSVALNAPRGIIQPSVVALTNNHLRLYARATANIGHIVIAESHDRGETWGEPHSLDLPNPNSGIDAVRLRDGRFLLVYNHSSSARTPLNLAVSGDGVHFRMFRTLESGPGEFSYPASIQAKDGNVLITYTWKRQKIKFVSIPLSEIPR